MKSFVFLLCVLVVSFCYGQTPEQIIIQQQIDAASALGGGTVVLPEGETELIRLPSGQGSGCLLLASNVILEGHPNGSVLKLGDNQINGTRLLLVEDDTDVTIRNMTLDGNKDNQIGEGDHRAGIFALSCSNLLIENITAQNFTGDGIQIYTDVDGLEIKNFLIQDTDRDGIALTGFGSNILIHNGTFTNVAVQAIDFEPNSLTWLYTDVVIHDCTINHFVGKGRTFMIVNVDNGLFYNNDIQGTIHILYSNNIRFIDNNVYDGNEGAVWIRRSNSNILISQNDLQVDMFSPHAPIRVQAQGNPGEYVEGLEVLNNNIVANSPNSVHIQGGKRITLSGNEIDHNGSNSVMYIRSTIGMEDLIVTGNNFTASEDMVFIEFRGFQQFVFDRVTITGNNPGSLISNVNAILLNYYSNE